MMQQQQAQRDLKNGVAAGTGGTGKRLSGVMEGFFTVRYDWCNCFLFLFFMMCNCEFIALIWVNYI